MQSNLVFPRQHRNDRATRPLHEQRIKVHIYHFKCVQLPYFSELDHKRRRHGWKLDRFFRTLFFMCIFVTCIFGHRYSYRGQTNRDKSRRFESMKSEQV